MSLTFIGAMFVVNLVVAVLFIRFQQAKELEEKLLKARKKEAAEEAKRQESLKAARRLERRKTIDKKMAPGSLGAAPPAASVSNLQPDQKTADPEKGGVYVVNEDEDDRTYEEKAIAKAEAEARAEELAELEREEKVANMRVRDIEPDDPIYCVLHQEVKVRADLNMYVSVVLCVVCVMRSPVSCHSVLTLSLARASLWLCAGCCVLCAVCCALLCYL